jgi:AraC-like DNA-binding protein
MDVLANVLGATQCAKPVFCQSELVAPFGLAIPAHTKTVVHLVRRGYCWLRVEGESAPIRLGPGDVVLVARGLAHTITDTLETSAQHWEHALTAMKQRLAAMPDRAPSQSALLLCAAYEFEQEGQHPLLSLLPPVIRLHIDDRAEDNHFQALVRLLVNESTQQLPGAEIVQPRLVDSLFVFIVRRWLEGQPVGAAGWFGALRDPPIGRALGLIHENPAQPWTVDTLARQVGLSRAAFARRFGELVGEPPLRYLTRWRMSLAARILKLTGESVDAVATRVGYDSPTAFGKAFQRHLRISPGRYRSEGRTQQLAAAAVS